jgi:thioredoxin 1
MIKHSLSLLLFPLALTTVINSKALPLSSQSEFAAQVLNSTTPVIVDVWSPECPACRKFKPIFERIALGSLGSKISFYTLNFLASEELMAIIDGYKVDRIPARLYFKQGALIAHETGFISDKLFVQEIQTKLGL